MAHLAKKADWYLARFTWDGKEVKIRPTRWAI